VRFKLDENLPASSAATLTDAGHDVDTVAEEHLSGAPDPDSPGLSIFVGVSGRSGSGRALTGSGARLAMTPHIGQSDADDLSSVSGWRRIGHTWSMSTAEDVPFSYAEVRPYVVAESLDELEGPVHGPLVLPRELAWSGRRSFDLDDDYDRSAVYKIILEEGLEEHFRRYLNARLLVAHWRRIRPARQVAALWERRFPELATAA